MNLIEVLVFKWLTFWLKFAIIYIYLFLAITFYEICMVMY